MLLGSGNPVVVRLPSDEIVYSTITAGAGDVPTRAWIASVSEITCWFPDPARGDIEGRPPIYGPAMRRSVTARSAFQEGRCSRKIWDPEKPV